MDINTRLSQFYEWYIKENQLTQKEFAEAVGISPSQLSSIIKGRDKAGLAVIEKFLNLHSDIDANWLLTGKGKMFKQADAIIDIPIMKPKTEETRPRIPLNAAAGTMTVALDGVKREDAEEIPLIRAFRNYDFTILVNGDSMEPEFHPGDEIACIYVTQSSFIQWGRIHAIDTSQGILVKRIYDDGDCIICKSEENELYKDFRIPKEEIYNLGLVIGMLRRY